MTDGKLSRAHVGLALASALVVLLASGVAIFRMDDGDDDSSVSSSASTSSPPGPVSGPGDSGAAAGTSGPGTPPGSADQAAAAADTLAAADTMATKPAVKTPVRSRSQGTGRRPAAETSESSAGAGDTPGSDGAGSDGAGSDGAGSDGAAEATPSGDPGTGSAGGGPPGGQEAPPQPSQDRPEGEALVAASVSVGEGAQGGVVAAAVTGTTPEADVTLGTDQVIGDHPPSQGTGINFGGRFLQPPPSAPLLG